MTTPAPAPVQVPKSPWKSLTMYAALATAVLGGLQTFGAVPPGTNEAVMGLVSIIASMVAMYGRARAQGPVTLSGK